MIRMRELGLGLLLASGLSMPAVAAEISPEATVKQIYSGKTPETKGIDIIGNAKLRAKYLSKDLAAAVKKDIDESAKSGEVGALDFDPVSDSQDPMIKDLKIEPASVQGDRAQVSVSFDRGDPKRDELVYDLVKENEQWRVSNISKKGNAQEAWSLRQMLSLK
ncbi:DUF3828 domain-containing protein [Labrys sp. LIt4]|uniref:DUF3828 domain-containing protein n=1 Tax=Labrys sp. LIt4 TaxID=2821355 RepID=UPI001ADF9FCC|nr:DUF3828 domain-containing protein [Labrys sp. LIt4]MBP0579276.1 DUF3828 domain-containing protein [Labrys sp. LIt4]